VESQLPRSAENIDAVRLMTIHGSKGLEFDAVHLPGMVTSGLPRNNVPPRCLPPDGLIHGSESGNLEAVKAGHDEKKSACFRRERATGCVVLLRQAGRWTCAAPPGSSPRSNDASPVLRPCRCELAASTGVPIAITWQGRPQWTDIRSTSSSVARAVSSTRTFEARRSANRNRIHEDAQRRE
jgi:hypothetical protein